MSMDSRCNGKAECLDGSDETDCTKIKTFAGYNKFLVPPPKHGEDTLDFKMAVIIDDIITIDETNGYFKVKITLIRNWFNPLLQYKNLKRTAIDNVMVKEDIDSMWMPWTVLDNIEAGEDYKLTDLKRLINIIPHPEFKFVHDDQSNIRLTMLFKGSENAINYELQITVNFICNYDMRWYPFDTQICTMRLWHIEQTIQATCDCELFRTSRTSSA